MARGQVSRDVHLPGRTQVPDGWQMVHLGDVTAAQQGGTPPKSRAEYWDGDIPFVTGADLSEFSVSRDNARSFLTVEGLNSGATVICEPGALLLATRTRVGLVSIAGETMGASQDITLLTPSDLVEPSYLCRTLMSQTALLQRSARGTTIQGVSRGEVDSLPVLLPPPAEQRAIAGALSDVDGLLGDLEGLIAKKRAIKQAAMQQLLTGKTRLPGFTEVWRTKRLRDTCTFLPTANNPRADLSDKGDVEYIHYGDIHAYARPVMDCTSSNLPRTSRSRVGNAAELVDGDLVMVDASEDLPGVGKSIEVQGVSGRTIVAGLHTILCRGNQDAWATGFKAYLQFLPTFRSALARLTSGTSVYAISKKQLADVEVQLPALAEQEAIVSVLSDMDAEIAKLEQRRYKIDAIKQGMMQELLTGRVRLVKPDVVAEASSC